MTNEELLDIRKEVEKRDPLRFANKDRSDLEKMQPFSATQLKLF
jgi:hypothetical protein